jgi:hypothetical protein
MTLRPTTAERLDRAIDDLFDGASAGSAAARSGLSGPERSLVRTAESVRLALGATLVSPRFEARLGSRLSGAAGAAPWILRHPGRLIVTGAVGSAVGVGVTAYAVWRSSRRSAGAHRLLHR